VTFFKLTMTQSEADILVFGFTGICVRVVN
jgi:hypothetical protein